MQLANRTKYIFDIYDIIPSKGACESLHNFMEEALI